MVQSQNKKTFVCCPQCKVQTLTIGAADAAKAEAILVRQAFVRLGLQSSGSVPKRHELKQAFEMFSTNRVSTLNADALNLIVYNLCGTEAGGRRADRAQPQLAGEVASAQQHAQYLC